MGHPMAGHLAQAGHTVTVTDISADHEMAIQASISALNLRSLMCVPLLSKQETLGVLYVDSQAALQRFTESDLEVLVAIAGHAGVAIRNALLYEQTIQRAADLERTIEQYRTVNFEASTDELTGLRNRRFFETQAAQEMEISLRYNRPLSVIILDVDHFKRFNDLYGHATGDQVLQLVSQVLASTCRGSDLPARWGGEEFVVLCPDTPAAGACDLAERLRDKVSQLQLTHAAGDSIPRITISCGVASHRPEHQNFHALVADADQALYRAKGQGRNRVQVATVTVENPA
jgi:diguanylate cyclase (GGDEF)-like protein